LRTIGPGSAFGDLPKGPRETPKTSPKVVAKTDLIIFYIEHDKYWKLVQGQKEADEQARRRTLLSSLYPAWGDAGDEAAQHKRDYEIRKMAAKLKLKSLQPGETLLEQGQEISEIYFVVSGEMHITVDLELVEIYPGSVKKIEERRTWQEKKVEAAKGVSDGAGSEGQDRISTRISQSLTPRQLGLVRDCQLKLGCACPGDSIGDSHLWKDYPTYKNSAIASTVAEVAYMSVQAFKDCPSRFLLLRYKASELNIAETRDILARLLRIEALEGWKPSIPTDDIVPHLPTKMPAWLGQQSSVASRAQLKPSSIRMKNDDKETWLDNPEGLHRKLLFHTASQSMTALAKNADKQPAPEPVTEDEIVSSLEYQLLFGGRDNLREKQWHPYTPRQQETPRAHEPYQHPRARPATAPEPWWKRGECFWAARDSLIVAVDFGAQQKAFFGPNPFHSMLTMKLRCASRKGQGTFFCGRRAHK
jgi:CRP-like cAMP-binding protein